MVIVALVLTVRAALIRPPEPSAIPALQLLALRGAPGDAALAVFQAGERIVQQPGGWGAEGFHLHGEVNGREVMPGPRAIERGENGTYEWLFPTGGADHLRISLYWSDANHQRVEGSATRELTLP